MVESPLGHEAVVAQFPRASRKFRQNANVRVWAMLSKNMTRTTKAEGGSPPIHRSKAVAPFGPGARACFVQALKAAQVNHTSANFSDAAFALKPDAGQAAPAQTKSGADGPR